jgi:PhnB protein
MLSNRLAADRQGDEKETDEAMKFTPYLNFDGTCAEAFAFYEKALGGTITFKQTFGESPMADQVSKDWRDKVMHVTLAVGDQILMGSDAPPGRYGTPRGMMVSIQIESPEQGERIFNRLADGGSVELPFQKTFWSGGFGMVTDRFGIPWMVNAEVEQA